VSGARSDLRATLVEEFCSLRPRAEAGQLAAGAGFAAAAGATAPVGVVAWFAALGLAILVARRLRRGRIDPGSRLRAARLGVAATALVWCAGLLLFLPGADPDHRGAVLIVAVGFFAALASTTAADTPSHRIFSLALLAGLLPPLVSLARWREAVIVSVFALVMEVLRVESRRGLIRRIAAQLRLARRATRAQRERRELEQLLEHAPWGFAVIDEASGRLLRASRAFQALLGVPGQDLEGHPVSELLPASVMVDAAEGPEAIPLCRPDGSIAWLRLASTDVSGPSGPARLLLCEDVTARSLQQEAERRYRELVESASDLVWRIDGEGRWCFLNEAAARIYGRPVHELLGRPAIEQVAPQALPAARAALQKALAGERIVDHETVNLHSSGELRHLSFAAWPVYDGAGQVVGAQGIARDVTERVAARDALATLVRERALLASLIDASPDLVFVKDADSRYLWANAAFARYLGREPGEIAGLTDIDIAGSERGAALQRSDREVLAAGTPGRFEGWLEYADGRRSLAETVITPARSESGEVVGLIGISRDITERHQAEDELKRLAARAEHATRMKSEFLALMSHEIRTPLHGVLGMLELLLAAPLSEEQRNQAEVARGSAQALLTLLGDILDFSRIEAGKLEVESAPFDLQELLEGVVAIMTPLAAERGSRVVLDLDGSLPRWVTGDSGRLRQVVTNLVSNAGKFTEQGEVRLSVRPEAGRVPLVRISVGDTGAGIPDARIGAIFEPFTQADSSVTRRNGGTGLGLAISRRLVDLMGGDLTCHSELGKGSVFSFAIHLPETRPIQAPAADAVALPEQRVMPLVVLLVEDNRVNQRVARLMLEKRGHSVVVACDGHEALEAAARQPFDVVLMDIQMPGMDGLQATATLRARGFADLPVVALTAHAYAEERERCVAAGMDGFLTKPFKMVDLVGVVERWGTHRRRPADVPGPAARG
jgi:PAS domain S-box-containing protein